MVSGSFKDRIRDSGRIFLVAVGGDSGSGKSTFVRGITEMLGADLVSSFSLDDYHSLDREQRKKKKITPLNPRANNLSKLAADLRRLKSGKSIMKPVYNHADGTFGAPVKFKPTPVVIIEGLHPLYNESLRRLSDFKIFVDPDKRIKRMWKLKRDVRDRGHKKADVLAEMMVREPDYEKFIDVQKIYAEVVIEIHPTEVSETDDIYSIKLIQLGADMPLGELDLSIDLSTLLHLSERNFSLKFQKDTCFGHPVGVLTMDGEIHRDVVKNLEDRISAYTGKRKLALFSNKHYISTTNLAQLILCWRFIEKVDSLLSRKKR
jgi:phosphoribulokinase